MGITTEERIESMMEVVFDAGYEFEAISDKEVDDYTSIITYDIIKDGKSTGKRLVKTFDYGKNKAEIINENNECLNFVIAGYKHSFSELTAELLLQLI